MKSRCGSTWGAERRAQPIAEEPRKVGWPDVGGGRTERESRSQSLIRAGTEMSGQARDGSTPVSRAAAGGRKETAEMLLAAGAVMASADADVDETNSQGE